MTTMVDTTSLKFNDALIWDSGFGVDVCQYQGESIVEYSARCLILSGIEKGEFLSLSYSELFIFSDELYNELVEKYN